MASTLKVDTITGVATAGSIAITGEGNSTTTNLQQGLCKAWGHYDHDVLEDSFNLASKTDNGTGDYTFTLSSIMANVTYCPSNGSNSYNTLINTFTTSSVDFNFVNQNNSADDGDIYGLFHGDLA